jgi:uncharacterized YccA/Bax inhibitor family protein
MAMMRTANPALNEKTFEQLRHAGGAEAMSLDGTVNKCLILIGLLIVTAGWIWTAGLPIEHLMTAVLVGLVGGFAVALVTVFKKDWAGYTAPVYAVLEGLVLGGISSTFEAAYPGIALQAVALTFGTLFCLLIAYKSGYIQATENFKLGVVAATGAIFFIYLVSFVLGFFHMQVPYLHDSGWIGIGISLFIVVVAALNLVLDFDFIESGVDHQAPKYMEWYAAFGLLVTLVWLYLEMLRLLAKLNSRR